MNANDLLESPAKNGANSDDDKDFSARDDSEAEESAEDADFASKVADELRSDGERPSRSTILSDGSSAPRSKYTLQSRFQNESNNIISW